MMTGRCISETSPKAAGKATCRHHDALASTPKLAPLSPETGTGDDPTHVVWVQGLRERTWSISSDIILGSPPRTAIDWWTWISLSFGHGDKLPREIKNSLYCNLIVIRSSGWVSWLSREKALRSLFLFLGPAGFLNLVSNLSWFVI